MPRLVTSFDSVVLAAVARDVAALVGSRVTRVVQPDAEEIVIALHGPSGAGAVVCSIHPQWARIHLGSLPGGTGPSGFAQMLRGRLDAARLVEVRHTPFERVLTLIFDTVGGRADLVAELMGRHSNLILVQDDTITGSLKAVPASKSAVRQVLPGRRYIPPPRNRPLPTELTRGRLEEQLAASDDPLARRLVASLLGVGPALATELAVRAHLDPAAPARAQAAAGPVWDALADLVRVVTSGAFSPVIYYRGDEPVGFAPFPFEHLSDLRMVPAATMSEAVEIALGSHGATARLEEQRASLLAAVRAARARVERIEAEVRQAAEEAARPGALRQHGELLLAYASQVPAGASEVTLPGFDGAPVTIPLDPALSAVDNAQQLFRRYRRMRAARPALDARLRAAAAERAYLESAAAMIEQAATPDDLLDLRRELAGEGVLRAGKAAPRGSSAGPRRFPLAGGLTALVGRTNRENDAVTFTLASPDDLWLHARGVPGAHVVLRTGKGTPARDAIREAAALAAYFSRARDSLSVAVDVVQRKFVRKPRGAKPGLVTYTHERTVHVRPALPGTRDPGDAGTRKSTHGAG